jgi:hypothetical protein
MWGRKQKIVVKRYTNEREFSRDANRMAKQGYIVASTTSEKPRAGCARILTLGIFTLLFPPKQMLVVTYTLKD